MNQFSDTFPMLMGHPDVPVVVRRISVLPSDPISALSARYSEHFSDKLPDISLLLPLVEEMDSPALPSLLAALHVFVHRFTHAPTAPKWAVVKSHILRAIKKTQPAAVTRPMHLSDWLRVLLRFHRPEIAVHVERLIGHQLALKRWLASCMMSACTDGATGRNLMVKISASGEALAGVFLAIAALDEIGDDFEECDTEPTPIQESKKSSQIFSKSFSISSLAGEDNSPTCSGWEKSIEQYRVSGHSIWDRAVVLSSATPSGLGVGNFFFPELSSSGALDQILRQVTGPSGDGSSPSIPSVSIGSSAFSLVDRSRSRISVHSAPSRVVFVDVRTDMEREKDEKKIHTRGLDSEWWDDNDDNAEQVGPELHVIRLRRCLWFEQGLGMEEEKIFLALLEFYRGQGLCLVGSGGSVVEAHLRRELFPYVTVLKGGAKAFGDLAGLVIAEAGDLIEKILICRKDGEDVSSCRRTPEKSA